MKKCLEEVQKRVSGGVFRARKHETRGLKSSHARGVICRGVALKQSVREKETTDIRKKKKGH